MEIFHYSGRDESDCELVESNLLKEQDPNEQNQTEQDQTEQNQKEQDPNEQNQKEQEMRNWAQIFKWLFFTVVVCGMVGLAFTAMKKNQKKGYMNYSLLQYELELIETREPTIFER
jgi:ATP-dependent Zn protease